jgi:hypothetical protein
VWSYGSFYIFSYVFLRSCPVTKWPGFCCSMSRMDVIAVLWGSCAPSALLVAVDVLLLKWCDVYIIRNNSGMDYDLVLYTPTGLWRLVVCIYLPKLRIDLILACIDTPLLRRCLPIRLSFRYFHWTDLLLLSSCLCNVTFWRRRLLKWSGCAS